MNLYAEIVPSREICEELEKAGICQDEPKLFYVNFGIVKEYPEFRIEENSHGFIDSIIAPTIPRMMDELPDESNIYRCGSYWFVDTFYCCAEIEMEEKDKHLPNAVAKALLAIKKG